MKRRRLRAGKVCAARSLLAIQVPERGLATHVECQPLYEHSGFNPILAPALGQSLLGGDRRDAGDRLVGYKVRPQEIG
jgi:hypothetical protein